MARSTIYIVQGCTGEYSDYQDRNVCAFRTLPEAEVLRGRLAATARRLGIAGRCGYAHSIAQLGKLREVDPDAECDYTGVTYLIVECPFEENQ